MKKFLSLLFCMMLFLSLAVTASAEDGVDPNTCSHSYTNWTTSSESHSRSCNLCSASESAAHGFGNWTISGDGHSRSCSTCGYTESGSHNWDTGTVTQEASCSADGIKTFSCLQCGQTYTDGISATGVHTYQNGVKVDDKQHTLTCPGCSRTVTENHVWDTGREVTDATCKQEGKKSYTCTKCPATKEETIPITAHSYGEWGGDQDYHVRTCSKCGNEDKGAHSWKEAGYEIEESTCKDYGSVGFDCSGCDQTLVVPIAELADHTYDNACDPDCNVCGDVREAGHKFNTYLTYNSSGHWYACSKCTEKKDFADHVPGPAATEDKAQVCLTCGYEMTPKLNHSHDYSKTKWESDDSGHWHVCKGCEVELEFDEHTYNDKCSSKCTVCGYLNDDSHTFEKAYESDKYSHWQVCTVCKAVSTVEDHIPGPEATISEPQLCTVCGYELVPVIDHTHKGGEWLSSDTEHWRECECGEELNAAIHDWDEGTENKDSTVTYRCVVCEETKTVGEPQEKSGFPWWILLVLLIICLVGVIGVLIYFWVVPKNNGKFSQK